MSDEMKDLLKRVERKAADHRAEMETAQKMALYHQTSLAATEHVLDDIRYALKQEAKDGD